MGYHYLPKLAVYDATMIMAKPAQTIPNTLELKERGVPSPTPLLSNTPQANQKALEKFSASSSGSEPFSWAGWEW